MIIYLWMYVQTRDIEIITFHNILSYQMSLIWWPVPQATLNDPFALSQ